MTKPSILKIKKAVVTGGAGFIGSHIASALVEMGCRVTVVDNLSTGKRENLSRLGNRVDLVVGDIRDQLLMEKSCLGCEALFHQAAVVSVPKSVEDPVGSASINDMGTLTVLEAARTSGVRKVVLASSSAVYGEEPTLPKTENMPPQPKSPYALHKWINEKWAELYHSLYGVEVVCLRYFNVYGPRQDPSSPYSGVISIFMAKAVHGGIPCIHGDGGQTRDFVYVADVVNANLLAAAETLGTDKVFNIGTGSRVSISELWNTIVRLTKNSSGVEYGPDRPGDIRHSVADITRANKALGFCPKYDFEKGISLTKDWYLSIS